MKTVDILDQKSKKLTRLNQKVLAKIEKIFNLRLSVALLAAVTLLFVALNIFVNLSISLLIILFAAFIFLFFQTRKLKNFSEELLTLKNFYWRQHDRQRGFAPHTVKTLFHSEFTISETNLINDLDLVGPHSLLTQIDETFSIGGQKLLLEWMLSPKLNLEEILFRQQIVIKLSQLTGFFRRWTLKGLKTKTDTTAEHLVSLANNSLVDSSFTKRFYLLSFLCLAYFGSLFFKIPSLPLWLAYFFFSIYSLKKIDHVFTAVQDFSLRMDELIEVFRHLENLEHHDVGSILFPTVQKYPLSQVLKNMNSLVSFLSTQSHPLIHFILNGLVPWSYFFTILAEKNRKQLSAHLPLALEEIQKLDALLSLTYQRFYQTKTVPIFNQHPPSFKKVRHPLIFLEKVVSNDFNWPANTKVCLITGSNMAGKSTFLRTVGVNHILALMGATVFADEMTTMPVELRSCIRVSDSVRDGVSYFYAETQRLAEILNGAKENRPIFFLIDEVFKGTNNRERLIGGQTLLTALAETKSFGMITTHDLELTQIAGQNKSAIYNFHFRDDIKNNQMHFSYKIQDGPCPTTNALKIMSMAGIPVPL